MGPRGHLIPRAPACSGTPPLPKPGWGPVRGYWWWWWGVGTRVGRRAPPSALRASQALLTKLHFEINSVAAGASEGYGCHGDGAKEEAPGWPGLGQGMRALLEIPRPACREGQGRLAQLSPGLCLLIPLLYNLSVYVCIEGCQWELSCWEPGMLGAGPASSHLYHRGALRIYFCFQFPNFDSLTWQPGLMGSELCR